MTKLVRIENADLSTHKVKLIVQVKNAAGEWVDDVITSLNNPTQLSEQFIHSSRRIIIEETN